MKIHSSWTVQKTQNTVGLENNRFSRWKLAKISISCNLCSDVLNDERADLIVRCELWWSLLLLLCCRCYCRYCRHIANETVKINKSNVQMNEHFISLLLNHHAIVWITFYFVYLKFSCEVKSKWCSWEICHNNNNSGEKSLSRARKMICRVAHPKFLDFLIFIFIEPTQKSIDKQNEETTDPKWRGRRATERQRHWAKVKQTHTCAWRLQDVIWNIAWNMKHQNHCRFEVIIKLIYIFI